MAKKKVEVPTVENPNDETLENGTQTVENPQNEQVEEANNKPELENGETEEPNQENVVEQPSKEEIPVNVLKILKVFNDHEELYVSATGRVFSPEAKPSLRGNAILYKNPFYNSKQ